jgi:AcrR family transcriptional regulator
MITRNAERTKTAILKAAKDAFSQVGYAHAGVRQIAQSAGVDRALIVRYFGSKEGLFQAVLEQALPIDPFLQLDRARFGKQVVEALLSFDKYIGFRMMTFAATNPDLRALSMEACETLIVSPLAAWLGGPHARERATNLLTLWTGFIALWDLGLPSLRRMDPGVRRWLEDATQAIVDDLSDGPPSGSDGAV